jgi:hypothetical protein
MDRSISIARIALTLVVVLSGVARAQSAKDLVGTWTNVSNINIRPDGTSRPLKFVPTGRSVLRSSRGSMAIGLGDVGSRFNLFADHGHAPSNLGSRMRL